jgi:hypothetical protein
MMIAERNLVGVRQINRSGRASRVPVASARKAEEQKQRAGNFRLKAEATDIDS